jgi:hypothetical protein
VPEQISATVDRVEPYTTQLKIENKGREPLQWNFTNELPAWLSTNKQSGTISGFGSDNIELLVDPKLIANKVDYQLEISSNDLTKPKKAVRLLFSLINNKPVLSGIIPDQFLTTDPVQISLEDKFSDPDGDPINFHVGSNDSRIASVIVLDGMLTVIPKKSGTTLITVDAEDSFNSTTTISFNATVELITSVETEITRGNYIASPNPFEKFVSLRYDIDNPGNSLLYVVDISGRIVWKSELREETFGENEILINGAGFAAGIYNCILWRSNKFITTFRLVKN